MTRVPFNTDNIKKEYLKKMAIDRICIACRHCCSVKRDLIVSSINRNVVKDVQDLFEVTFSCTCNSQKKIVISKFFLPNGLFEEKYMQEVMKIAETNMYISCKTILDELLKWGRLEITNN